MAEVARPLPENPLAEDIPIIAKTEEDAQAVDKPVQDMLQLEDTPIDQMSNTFPAQNQITILPYQSPVYMDGADDTKTESLYDEVSNHSNADEILKSAEQKQYIDGQDLEMSDQA